MNVDQDKAAFDKEVRRYVYGHVMKEGLPPTIAQTSALPATPDDVEAPFQRLADGHSARIGMCPAVKFSPSSSAGLDRREPEWRRRTVDETEAIFAELGLASSFWCLPR